MKNQQRIDEILEQPEGHPDHSLCKKALDRAMSEAVPRTLTAWEWQEWYALHGVPDAHRSHQQQAAKPWWRRWL